MGCAVAIIFTNFGAAYGTAKSGIGIAAATVLRPDQMARSMSSQRADDIGCRLTDPQT